MSKPKNNNSKQQIYPDYDSPENSMVSIPYGKPQYQLSPQNSRENL